MEKALTCIKPSHIIRPWVQSCTMMGYTPDQITCFDPKWVHHQFSRPDKQSILLGLMIGGEIITPAVSDHDLLQTMNETEQEGDDELSEPMKSDEELLQAVSVIQQQPQPQQEDGQVDMFYQIVHSVAFDVNMFDF